MNHISTIDHSDILDNPAPTAHKELEVHIDSHAPRLNPSLNTVQLRACRIHFQHGGVCGGYTLDDWLEAEHELEDENQPAGKNKRAQ
ncbi:MAG TPA: hypothetical protein VN881_07765 [Candidatus Acidoferrales bacterium]|jgi:hypothetical protein|nr:hypothetical protein [Candidatus Acidoferrales bacterium]